MKIRGISWCRNPVIHPTNFSLAILDMFPDGKWYKYIPFAPPTLDTREKFEKYYLEWKAHNEG